METRPASSLAATFAGLCLLLGAASTLLAACGGSAPCGPCQATASAGLQNAGLPRSAKLEQLAALRVALARKRLAALRASFDKGATTIDELFAGCRDVAFAARDSGMHGEALRDVLTEYRDAVVALKDLMRERISKGSVHEDAMTRVDSLVAEAQYWLEDASQGP
jgi:hypothetical protein